MTIQYLERKNKPKLAYCYTAAAVAGLPTVMFLGGYRSDMTGTKALYLEEQCRARGQEFVRFDYSGHGKSEGEFEDGTIGVWKEDARAILDHVVPEGKVILAGSSMGGWVALLLALECPQRIAGLFGIAAAPDYTRTIHESLNEAQRRELDEKGYLRIPNDYSDEPYFVTKAMIEDGERQCLLDRVHTLTVPARLVQGMKDNDVPWQTAYRIKNAMKGSDVKVLLVENGNHRLSRPEDLALIDTQVREMSGL